MILEKYRGRKPIIDNPSLSVGYENNDRGPGLRLAINEIGGTAYYLRMNIDEAKKLLTELQDSLRLYFDVEKPDDK